MARYPRAMKPNFGLDLANVNAVALGTPALASANRFVTSTNMKNGAFTLAQTAHVDTALARSVSVTGAQVGGVDDTFGKVTVTGTNILGETISEDIVPVNGSAVESTKTFLTVSSVVQSGWTAGGTADTLVVGTGNLIGLPWGAVRRAPAVTAVGQIFLVTLGGAIVAVTATWDAADISKCAVNATAGTYNGSKALYAFIAR